MTEALPPRPNEAPGSMEASIRAFDWSAVGLGPLARWRQPLPGFMRLMLASPQPMFMAWGPERIWIYNDAFTPILGAKHPAALGQPSRVVWHEAWSQIEPMFDRVFAGEAVSMQDISLRLDRRGTLEEAHFSFSYIPATDEDGRVAGLFGVCEETTAQMASARSAREAEERLQLAMTAGGGVGTWEWNIASNRVVSDDYFARLYGVDPAMAGHGAPIEDFLESVHPDDAAGVRSAIEQTVADGSVFSAEYRLRQADGSVRWVLARGKCVFDGEGTPVRFPGVAFDITGRKRIEGELKMLNDDLALQVEARAAERDRLWRTSQDLLVVVDLDGVFSAANPAWTRVLGWQEDEVVGRSHLFFNHPDDAAASERALEVAANGALSPYENRVRHKDGSYRWISWTAAAENGRVYASGRHVTAEHEAREALRAAEEKLRQAQKMEAIGQLTGGLAHDFNNLLAGITGSLELARRRAADGRLSEIDRYLGAGLGAAKRAAALTHRLLAFSRRQTLEPKPLAVNRLVADMEDLIRRTIGPHIELEVVAAVGLWTIQADASQLENALLNLCINARDAMPEGGTLIVETANRSVDDRNALASELSPGQYVSLCVSDNGVGMPPDVVLRAFDPFFTTKPLGMGTGLGLSMIYGFAKQSGGHARIYSEPGKGTMVCVYLPRHHGDGPVAELGQHASMLAAAPEGKTILVLDDEPTVRMLVRDAMEELGFACLEAADGASALDILRSGARVDLLISDVGLPGGMNGRQVADAAVLMRPELQVLFITGYAENAVLSHGHLAPGMHVMTKPFEFDTLARRVKALIDQGASPR